MGERETTSNKASNRATESAAAATAIVQEYPLIKIRIDELVFDPSNPNVMTDDQIIGLRKSMQKFGYLTPIVVDLDNKIADGEHRAVIYKELGIEEIPAIKMKLETDADRRELRQVLNKLHGFHDKAKDADELVQLFQAQKLDELSELIAQPKEDLQRMMLRYHPGLEFVTPENEDEIDALIDDELKRIVPDTQLGDIWQLGENHKIACGDCTDERLMQKLLGDDKVDQLNCDPPYGVNYADKNKMLNEMDKGNHIQTGYANDELDTDYRAIFNTLFQLIPFTEYNTIYIWSQGYKLHDIRMAMEDSDIKWSDYLVWVKNNLVLGRKDYHSQREFCIYGWKDKHEFYGPSNRTNVLDYPKPQVSDLHPTTKPIELIRQTITDGSKADDIILDTFAGAGTSLIVSEMTGRRWRGIELDPHYVDICIKRWEKYTGKKAVKVEQQ